MPSTNLAVPPEALATPAVVCVKGVGVNGLGIVRSLGRAGIDVYAVVESEEPCLAAASKYCKRSIASEENDGAMLCRTLVELAKQLRVKPVLYFDNDKMLAVLADYVDTVKSCYFLTSDLGQARRLTDKEHQLDVALAAGLCVPRTWYPKVWSDFDEIDASNIGELIAKPSPSHFGAEMVPFKTMSGRNTEELRNKLRGRLPTPKGIIVQEFVAGGDEDIHIAMSYRNRRTQTTVSATIMKYLQTPPGAGIMAIGKPAQLPKVRCLGHQFLNYLDIDGISETEFKYSAANKSYYFIECNPRTAQFHTAGLAVGFDIPLIAHCETTAGNTLPIEYEQPYSDRYWVYVHAVLNSIIRSRRISFGIVRCMWKRKIWAIYAGDDLGPWIRHLAISLNQFEGRIRRKLFGLCDAIRLALLNRPR